jgi:hypothetical protein
MAPNKPKRNYTPNNPRKSGPRQLPSSPPRPSKQFDTGQKQPHMDGRGQSGQPPRKK